MDRGAWWATVHGVAKSQTRLSMYTHMCKTAGSEPGTWEPYNKHYPFLLIFQSELTGKVWRRNQWEGEGVAFGDVGGQAGA